MRILIAEQKWGRLEPDGTVKHVFDIVERWASLEDAVREIGQRIQHPYNVRWAPIGTMVEIDVDDPPDETLIALFDADDLERRTGRPAREVFAYVVQNTRTLEDMADAYSPELRRGIKRRPIDDERRWPPKN